MLNTSFAVSLSHPKNQVTQMFTNEDAQTLTRLGLTVSQAKAYFALAKVEYATIKTIAQNTKIARQDVYRIMSTLQNMGLAEKIISAKATMYKATPIKEGLSMLLQNKKEEYIEAEKQVNMIANNFNENNNHNTLSENAQFIVTAEITRLLKMHEELGDMTKSSIDAAIPLKMNKKMAFHHYPYIKRAIRRGVKIRVITKKVNGESMSRNPKTSSKNPLFELRHLPETSNLFGMHIFDEQQVTLAMSEKEPLPSLWTNNVHVAKLAKTHFENMWNNAQTS